MSLAQLRAVRTVLRRLATPLVAAEEEGGGDAEGVFQTSVLKGSRVVFPSHARRKAEAQVREQYV